VRKCTKLPEQMAFLRRIVAFVPALGLVLAASLVFSGVLLAAPATETAQTIAKVRSGPRTFTYRGGRNNCLKGGRTGRLDVHIGTRENHFTLTVAGRARAGRYRIPGGQVVFAPFWRRRVGDGPREDRMLIRGNMTIAPGLRQGTFSGTAMALYGHNRRFPASGSWSCARLVLVPD
jgi:hypothetical protein